MDVKKTISDLVERVKSDDSFKAKFKQEPVKAIEEALGIDLPDDQIQAIVSGVKAKVNLDSLGDIGGKIGGLLK
ncbi:MAG: hypothetical protein ACOX2M_04820 [Fastidiosipilaceae bacterium]